MKKRTLFTMILLLSTLALGCLKNEELPPPSITISQGENEILNFSTFQSANVNVHIESGEELTKFRTKTVPMSSWSDTTILFERFTHAADISLSFKIWKGFKVTQPDSIFEVTYTAYTEDTSCSVKRKLRYRFVYPELDSFDIKLQSKAMGKCLLDIDNRCAYQYTEYSNHNFDLVYVNEMDPNYYSFGTALISPDSPYLMQYFQRKVPTLIYDPAKRRSTQCGLIADATLDWSSFNSTMLGVENNWVQSDRISALSPDKGTGVIDLQKNKLFKFRLDKSGRYIMIRVLDRVDLQHPDSDISAVTLRVYLQR